MMPEPSVPAEPPRGEAGEEDRPAGEERELTGSRRRARRARPQHLHQGRGRQGGRHRRERRPAGGRAGRRSRRGPGRAQNSRFASGERRLGAERARRGAARARRRRPCRRQPGRRAPQAPAGPATSRARRGDPSRSTSWTASTTRTAAVFAATSTLVRRRPAEALQDAVLALVGGRDPERDERGAITARAIDAGSRRSTGRRPYGTDDRAEGHERRRPGARTATSGLAPARSASRSSIAVERGAIARHAAAGAGDHVRGLGGRRGARSTSSAAPSRPTSSR